MAGDQAIINYLQRVCGYCLTGLVTEHTVFFLYGRGGNGKGTFKETLLRILGSGEGGYAAVTPTVTFTAQQHEQHPTDIARLRGKRLTIATETEDGQRWALAKLKLMTGGDRLVGRFMHRDLFEYTPQFKVMVVGNTKPRISRVDPAIARRLHFIPFEVEIRPPELDLAFGEKLAMEDPAILRWMLDGCRAWQQQGLAPPRRVRLATKDYLQDEDIFTAWLNECCIQDAKSSTTLQDLFASWKSWAEARGEAAGHGRGLAQQLDTTPGLARGKVSASESRLLLWHGIRIRVGARP
jgi:P4 family phage/plasmid primase-like protien